MVHSENTQASIRQNDTNGLNNHIDTNGVNGVDNSFTTSVAVVGMACRFAGGVKSPADLWDLCTTGRDAWSPIPEDRFDVKTLYHPDKDRPGRQHAIGGYFMDEDVALFDAPFFNFPTDVANAMDPQIRLLLEVVYEATEDAGIPIESLAGTNTSVFSGCYGKDYHDLQTRDPEVMPPSFLTGNYTAMMSNRISHIYDLQGASMSIDTGCSSGIACLHQGCLTIQTGQSDVSIVGASSTILNPDLFLAMSTLGMIGTDGRCYAWDERAQGYGRGEGVAVLVLKNMDAALRDGDRIHAVIRNTGLNQDGKTQSITSPSADAQIQLIRDCYRRAGLDPSDTGYVEAHMTGTQVGDLTEAKALAQTFGRSRQAANESDPVFVGSVKTNVGHTEGVSGLAAIIKAAFAMRHRKIPKNLNYEVTNPKIKLKDWHLSVPTTINDWPSDKPLRTSINNFGYGGTNSHVILEGVSSPDSLVSNGHVQNGVNEQPDSCVFVVSAKDSNAARTMAKNLAAYLRIRVERKQELSHRDLAYTLAERRSRLDYVVSVKARNLIELADHLENPAVRVAQTGSKKPRLGFVFNGQGAQWHAMGRELLTTYPVFTQAAEEADNILRDYGADWSLKGMEDISRIHSNEMLTKTVEELMRDVKSTRVSEIHLSQPITVALQLCLVRLLWSWKVHPSAVVSHSSGEIAAAFAVGALSFREALGVVYHRGELARKYKDLNPQDGGMIAAGVSADDAEKYIADTQAGGRVVVACVNSPESVTLSGDADDIDEVLVRLERDSLFARKLKVGLAYHSHHMLSMAPEYTKKLYQILPTRSSWTEDVIFASPVTGDLIDASEGLPPDHWVQNLTNPVLFSDAFEKMVGSVDAIVEIGPHSTLSGPIRQILKGKKMPYTSCLKRNTNAVDTMQDLACDLLSLGHHVSLSAVNATRTQHRNFVPDLPTYAWNHTTRYWVESHVNKDVRQRRFPPHELLGLPVPGGTPLVTEWRNFLRLADVPWLADHQVDAQVVLPGAACVSMAVEAVRLLAGESGMIPRGYRLRDTEFLNALAIPESSAIEVRLRLQPIVHTDWYEFLIYSTNGPETWIENCRGQISLVKDHDTSAIPNSDSFLNIGKQVKHVDVPALLGRLREMTIRYGPSFQNLTSGRGASNRTAMDLRISSVVSDLNTYVVHPTTLDCIIQATYNSLPGDTSRHSIVLPKSISSMFVPSDMHKQPGDELLVLSELQKSQRRGFTSTVVVTNSHDNKSLPPLRMEDFFCQAIPRGTDVVDTDPETSLYKSCWKLDVLHDVPKVIKDSLRINLTDQDTAFEKKIIRASFYFMFDAISKMQKENKDNWKSHHKMMFESMLEVVARSKKGGFGPGSAMWSQATKGMKQKLFDELSRSDASGKLLVRIGAKLVDILRGQIDAFDLMMQDDLLSKYYMEVPKLKNRTYVQLAQVVKLYATKNPGAKVLEVGGGAGSATPTVLEAFGDQGSGGTLLGRYTFTDSSADFLKTASQNLAAWSSLIDFQTLDIDDITTKPESWADGSFDLIILSTVVHNIKNLEQSLRNARKLLKPGGQLITVTTTQNRLESQLIHGILPEWWLSEQTPKIGETRSVDYWDEALRRAGFTGVDFEIGDCEQDQFKSTNLILSRVIKTPKLSSMVSIVHTVPIPNAWKIQLIDSIQKTTDMPTITETWDDVQPGDKIYIFTADMTSSFLESMDQVSFAKLQSLLVRSRGILWLSCGGSVTVQSSIHDQTQGLLRTLRQEDLSKRYIHLDFERTNDGPWISDNIKHILHVLHHMDEDITSEDVDFEYAVKDDLLYVPRVLPNDGESKALEPEERLFHRPGQSLVWNSSELVFADNSHVKADLSDGMIEIEVRAFGIIPHDNTFNGSDSTYDLAGIVTRVGPLTGESRLNVGDRVCGLASGDIASTVRTHWTALAKLPDGMSFMDAACIPTAYATASHALLEVARLRKSETVLIHSVKDHVSQAAVVVAQHTGAEVFVVFSDNLECDMLINQFSLPSDHILAVQDMSLGTILKDRTKGKGIDVVFNGSPSNSNLEVTQDCIARFGRFIQIEDQDSHADWNAIPHERYTTCSHIDIMEVARYQQHGFKEALQIGVQIYHEMRHDSSPIQSVTQHPISQTKEAIQQRSKDRHAKVVMVVEQKDLVNVVTPPQSVSLTDSDATFLVVGGLGGIGQVIASWLMDKGAQNILLVSRNAESHVEAATLLEKAEQETCNLRIQNCDVSSEESLVKLLEQIRDMPPIRGVIDTAMVLNDSVFEQMTFDQWKRAVLPKIAGTINLDKHLPKDMSFFVLLSSLTGVIGHVSQANYAAGNTFQDSFARHRVANGQAAISVDLPAVIGAGVVANDEQARRRVEALGSKSISAQAVLELLEKVIKQRPTTPEEAQVIVNLEAWTKLAPDSSVRRDKRFGTLQLGWRRDVGRSGAGVVEKLSPSAMISKALDSSDGPETQTENVARALATRLAATFNIDVNEIDLGQPLAVHGVDSLVAVELRNWLAAAGGVKISIFEILQATSLHEIAALIIMRREVK